MSVAHFALSEAAHLRPLRWGGERHRTGQGTAKNKLKSRYQNGQKSSVVEPELQGAETFGRSWSRNVEVPAPGELK